MSKDLEFKEMIEKTREMVAISKEKLEGIILSFKHTIRQFVWLNKDKFYLYIELSGSEMSELEKHLTNRDLVSVDKFLEYFNIKKATVAITGNMDLSEPMCKELVPSKACTVPDSDWMKQSKERVISYKENHPTRYYCFSRQDPFEVKHNIVPHESADSSVKCAMSTIGNPKYGMMLRCNEYFDARYINNVKFNKS